ncbi:MAG: hypothetical protein AABY14_03465 [Nanoarchaeota archaeon]
MKISLPSRDLILNNLYFLLGEIAIIVFSSGTNLDYFSSLWNYNLILVGLFALYLYFKQIKLQKNKLLYNYLSFSIVILVYLFFLFIDIKIFMVPFILICLTPLAIYKMDRTMAKLRMYIQKTNPKLSKRKKGG